MEYCGTVFFMDRITKISKEDVIIDAILVTIFTLIRQPSIILVFFIVYKLSKNKQLLKFSIYFELLLIISPAIIFVLASFSSGNPAIDNSICGTNL